MKEFTQSPKYSFLMVNEAATTNIQLFIYLLLITLDALVYTTFSNFLKFLIKSLFLFMRQTKAEQAKSVKH